MLNDGSFGTGTKKCLVLIGELAKYYEVYRRTALTGELELIETVKTTSYKDAASASKRSVRLNISVDADVIGNKYIKKKH